MIHIICPFYREHLLPTLIKYLEPMNIIFHPVITPIENVPIQKDWIKPLVTPIDAYVIAYEKINKFIENYKIEDNDYYGFMGDDDMYSPGFFDVIREQTANILVYSLLRGDQVPEDNIEKHPIYPLIISKLSDMQVCNIGLLQYIVKGHILKQTRFNSGHKWGDGMYAEMLRDRFPNEIKFLPDLFAYGNYLQLGRYIKDAPEYA
jgi:hypothetical protein